MSTSILPQIQSYPPPTELPAMRVGELDGRYMDCSPALAPVGDIITDLSTITVVVTRRDGRAMGVGDIQPAGGAWPPTLDLNKMVVTMGWLAPPGSAGVTYLLTMTVTPTFQGRTFIRDWFMSVVPLLG